MPPGSQQPSANAGITGELAKEIEAINLGKGEPNIYPGFLFLQLQSYPSPSNLTPLLLKEGEATSRAVTNLDRIPGIEFHKVGVVYVDDGQTTEAAILANSHGSPRYNKFLQQLGKLVRLKDCKEIYTGGLDVKTDRDGMYSYYWQDDVTQIIYHIPTLMPLDQNDPNSWIHKKRHIGNNYVTIIYNDSSSEFRFGTLPSQFDSVNLIVTPLDDDTYQVRMKTKPGFPDFSPLFTPKVISASSVAAFVRQIAIHADRLSQVVQNQTFVSNFIERMRQIKRIHERCVDTRQPEAASPAPAPTSVPFTPNLATLESIANFTQYI